MSLFDNNMDVTIGQVYREAKLFHLSDEYRHILKESYEIDLLNRQIAAQEYVLENGIDDPSQYGIMTEGFKDTMKDLKGKVSKKGKELWKKLKTAAYKLLYAIMGLVDKLLEKWKSMGLNNLEKRAKAVLDTYNQSADIKSNFENAVKNIEVVGYKTKTGETDKDAAAMTTSNESTVRKYDMRNHPNINELFSKILPQYAKDDKQSKYFANTIAFLADTIVMNIPFTYAELTENKKHLKVIKKIFSKRVNDKDANIDQKYGDEIRAQVDDADINIDEILKKSKYSYDKFTTITDTNNESFGLTEVNSIWLSRVRKVYSKLLNIFKSFDSFINKYKDNEAIQSNEFTKEGLEYMTEMTKDILENTPKAIEEVNMLIMLKNQAQKQASKIISALEKAVKSKSSSKSDDSKSEEKKDEEKTESFFYDLDDFDEESFTESYSDDDDNEDDDFFDDDIDFNM